MKTKLLFLLGLCSALPLFGDAPKASIQEVPVLAPTPKMQTETRYLVHSLEQLHYLNKSLTDLDPREFIRNYMSDLDYNRLFFLKEDVTGFQDRFSGAITLYLRQQGNLYPAFEIFETYRDRVTHRIDWVEARLEEAFNFNQDDTYTPDRHKLDWPESEADADALWLRRVKYELLTEILSATDESKKQKEASEEANEETPLSEEERFEKALTTAKENVTKRYERIREAMAEIEASDVEEIFLSSLTRMYDPHSTFMSADSLAELSQALRNSLVGIGAILSMEDGYCTIKELMKGGPAEQSKLLSPKDKIVGVSDERGEMVDVIGMKLHKIVRLIRGKEGTEVKLLIQPTDGDPSDRKEIVLIRGTIKLTLTLAQAELYQLPVGERTVPIGVISLPAFYGPTDGSDEGSSTTHDVEELLHKLMAMGAEGIILDLRGNSGGLLTEAVDLTGLFIPSGPVVQVRDTVGQISEYMDRDKRIVWDGPMIVLVSRFSASASEILAGALKSHKRALIVGEYSTHGKGTVQVLFEMDRSLFSRRNRPKMGAAKVTIQKFYLPDGGSNQIKGVPSDISFPSINDFLPIGEADLPNPLPWDSIEPSKWDFEAGQKSFKAPISSGLIERLTTASQGRQAKLPEFRYLSDQITFFKEKQDKKTYSLNYAERKKQFKVEAEKRDSMKSEIKELAQDAYSKEEVLLAAALDNQEDRDAMERIQKEQREANGEDVDEDLPEFDIHLRESLRIMADWIEMLKNPHAPLIDESLAQVSEERETAGGVGR